MSATNETDSACNPDAPEIAGVVGEYYDSYPLLNVEQPIVICLDSNVFRKHLFSMKLWDDLENAKRSISKCRIIVPEVVLREIHRLFMLEAEKRCSIDHDFVPPDIRSACKVERDNASAKLRVVFQDYWTKWKRRLDEIASVVPIREADAKRAVERALDRRSPCRSGEEIRDAVIWECLLEECRSAGAAGVFVTENTRDFPFIADQALRAEADTNGIRWFRVWHHAITWLVRTHPQHIAFTNPSATTKVTRDFREEYPNRPPHLSEDDVISAAEKALQDYWCYDYDLEVVDIDRVSCEVYEVDSKEDETTEFKVDEQWFVEFSFSVSGIAHIGGSDGIEESVSGTETATATINTTKKVLVEADGVTINEVIVAVIIEELEYDDNWDPRDAWIDSLGEDSSDFDDFVSDARETQERE